MIKLQKSTFLDESDTKQKLIKFIQKSKKLSMGLECSKFEKNFSIKQKRQYSIYVNSGSSANLILIQSLINLGRIPKNSYVGVSSLTWPTNIMPIMQLGLKPLLIDCELNTLNVSLSKLKDALKVRKNIKCLFITNTLGLCDNLNEIKKFCKTKKIILIEDNCESLGSEIDGKLLGNFGLASTFSFFVGHHMSTIEGGMVCTDDIQLANQLTIVRSHGWDRNLSISDQNKLRKKFKVNNFYSKYFFYDLSYNLRPTEINGFIGNIQIKKLNRIIKVRQNNFLFFNKIFKRLNNVVSIKHSHMDVVSNFGIPVICKNIVTFKKLKTKFEKNSIEIRPMIAGNMQNQPFIKKYLKNDKYPNLSNSNKLHNLSFYFGNNPELTKNELNKIARMFNGIS